MSSLRAVIVICLGIGSSACPGGPASPATAPKPVKATKAEATKTEAAKATLEDAAGSAKAPTPAAGSDLRSQLVGAVLAAPAMVAYLHPEVEGRIPVVVSGSAVEGHPVTATAQGAAVQQRTKAEAAADPEAPVVFFDRIIVLDSNTTAKVSLRYPIEGVVGTVELRAEGSAWVVTKAELSER